MKEMHAVCFIIKTECAFGAAARAAIFAGVQPSRLKYFCCTGGSGEETKIRSGEETKLQVVEQKIPRRFGRGIFS
ncbi:MAG: hypothetical protein PUB84_06345 [Bacteroidales bacterium]|nr:hypothetical protein [Bacteroidales bacterium]